MSSNPNDYQQQKLRGLKRKYEAVQMNGGKCMRCGYNKNLAALDFHHRDPNTKKFQIDIRAFSNTNLDTLREELDKCDLLCANCHREEHNPSLDINNISSKLEECNKTSFTNESGSICPVCGKRFPKSKGKIYCSKECRELDKHYPTIEEVNKQYEILKSWEKVSQHFGLTRWIIQGIRKRNS